MLVGERMSHPVIFISPSMSVPDALNLMKREQIRRLPIISDGKLVGIVSDKDLIHASASSATSLSIWELNYLLSKIKVGDVMTSNVITVSPDTPIEEAARIMADHKIGGLPVVKDSSVVGIITETDLFRIFLELLGARESGLRVSVLVADQPGSLARLTQGIASMGGNIVALGQFAGESSANREVTFKVSGLSQEQVISTVEPLVDRLLDVRNT